MIQVYPDLNVRVGGDPIFRWVLPASPTLTTVGGSTAVVGGDASMRECSVQSESGIADTIAAVLGGTQFGLVPVYGSVRSDVSVVVYLTQRTSMPGPEDTGAFAGKSA